ncbi:hypothetical protein ACHAXS_002662 [Conticribra weissflogii]
MLLSTKMTGMLLMQLGPSNASNTKMKL